MFKSIEEQKSNLYYDESTGLRNLLGLREDYAGKDLKDTHFIYVDIDDTVSMGAIFGMIALEGIYKSIATTLDEYCGHSDVYRIANEHFVIATNSHIICEPSELIKILKQPVKRNGSTYIVKATVAVLDSDDFPETAFEDLGRLMRFAIDVTKKKGLKKLVFIDKKMKDLYEETREIEQHIFKAVRNKEFLPKFQPFVDVFTNKIIGFETVSRWNLNGKILKPDKFLEIAEWTGLIYAIEINMFKETLRFLRELKDDKTIKLSSRFKASINFSAYTLTHLKVNKLREILREYKLKTSDIIIEIKEYYITDPDAYKMVEQLHYAGFLIALDEYTNTSSSLTYLADLKVDILKLSECLLDKIDSNQEYTKMFNVYKFMCDIGKKFDLTIVSSGISNSDHVKLVKSLSINIGSGKLFSRAVFKEDFIGLFQTIRPKRG
mgnify:CR=1 FL=1